VNKNDAEIFAICVMGILCPPLLFVLAIAGLLGHKSALLRERPNYRDYEGIKVMAQWWTERLRPLVPNDKALSKFQKELMRLLGDRYESSGVFSYVRCTLKRVSWWDGDRDKVLYKAARKAGIAYETVLASAPAGNHSVAQTRGDVRYARGSMRGHNGVFASVPGESAGWIWVDPKPLPV
jgi:hypothetical protein